MRIVVYGFEEVAGGTFLDPDVFDDYCGVFVYQPPSFSRWRANDTFIYGVELSSEANGKLPSKPLGGECATFDRFVQDYAKHHGVKTADVDVGLFIVESAGDNILEYLYDCAGVRNDMYTFRNDKA